MSPDDAKALVGSLVDEAKRLGLTWQIRPATVTAVTSGAAAVGVWDGDPTSVEVPLIDLAGVIVGDRVYVMSIAEGGNYIIGSPTANTRQVECLGANASDNGTVATTPAGAEIAVPSASWDEEPTFVFPNGYVFMVHAAGIMGVASDQQVGGIRVRKGQATVSGTELLRHDIQVSGVFVSPGFSFNGYIKNTSGSEVRTQLSLTIARVGGAGNVALSGTASTRLVVAVYRIGTVAKLPGIADAAISV